MGVEASGEEVVVVVALERDGDAFRRPDVVDVVLVDSCGSVVAVVLPPLPRSGALELFEPPELLEQLALSLPHFVSDVAALGAWSFEDDVEA